MATTVTIGGTEVSYSDFEIRIPVSEVGVAPTARLTITARESVSAGDTVTIAIDGTTKFDGIAESGGEIREQGGRRLEARHEAATLFGEQVTLTVANPTDEDVLQAALSNANSGAGFTLNYVGTATSLSDDYDVENRTVKRVFRDMMDRTSRVWWVDPAGNTITVAPKGNRGRWKDIDTQADRASLTKFDSGGVESVRNDVTVVGTGGEAVEGSAEDSTSISNFGRQSESVNVSYITTSTEASAMASELLIPNPLAEGELDVGANVGDVTVPLVNYTVDIADAGKGVDVDGLLIEQQTIRQGRATLKVGEGSGVSLASVNRQSKSNDDVTEPGSVYGNARLADDSVDSPQLVDASVIENKLDDLSVSLSKVQDGAISETKVQDDSISTPKLQAGAVTAAKILADTITANEIAADTITALEIAANTLTANEIDVLDLDAGELSVTGEGLTIQFDVDAGGQIEPDQMSIYPVDASGVESTLGLDASSNEWSFGFIRNVRPVTDQTGAVGSSTAAYDSMYAHNYVTASPDRLSVASVDEIRGTDWYDNPPEAVRERARELGESDGAIPPGRDHVPVELSTMANWLLEAVKTQQEKIDDLEARIEALESGE